MPPFNIQFVNGLYLSKLNVSSSQFKDILKPTVENLALLGDICNPLNDKFMDFMSFVSDNWKTVYYVPGVLELEHSDIKKTIWGNQQNHTQLKICLIF